MKIDPKDLDRRERSRLIQSVYAPRPIAFVSTISNDGILNLAPYSMTSIVTYNPMPVVFFTASRKDSYGGPKKDTLVNVEQTKEFVVNMVTEDIARNMNLASGGYAPEIDEFKVSGLTPVPSDLVRPPRVAESPVSLECRLLQIIPFGEPEIAAEMVLGEVLRVHVRDDLYRDGIADAASLRVVGRMGPGFYTRTRDIFEMPSPSQEEIEQALSRLM